MVYRSKKITWDVGRALKKANSQDSRDFLGFFRALPGFSIVFSTTGKGPVQTGKAFGLCWTFRHQKFIMWIIHSKVQSLNKTKQNFVKSILIWFNMPFPKCLSRKICGDTQHFWCHLHGVTLENHISTKSHHFELLNSCYYHLKSGTITLLKAHLHPRLIAVVCFCFESLYCPNAWSHWLNGLKLFEKGRHLVLYSSACND